MTDWEQNYVEGYTPWNKGKASPPMVEWVSQNQPQGRALVPGCGVGHDVVMLVDVGLDAHGLDIAPTAIAMARAAYPNQVTRFVLGDLFATPLEWQESFDFLFEHTCLCALPPEWRPRYEAVAYQLLKTGAQLVGIWFIHPEMDPDETGPPFGISVSELSALFDESRWQVIEDRVPEIGYDGRVGRERLRVLRKL
jgi:SAM-dependent methyltransferase